MIIKMHSVHIDEIMKIWLNENISAHNFIEKSFWISKFDAVKEAVKKSEIYVYIKDNEVVGFVGIANGCIQRMFVKQNFQRIGIGKKLLEKCKSKYRQISLKVFKDNPKALNFYIKNSFRIMEECVDIETERGEYFMQYCSSSKF